MLGLQARPFDERYIPEPNSGCWLWEDQVDKRGYGRIKYRMRKYGAHRFSWMIHRGDIPAGMHVLHKCDTPGCVNPDHLFLGTHLDNARDRARKKRSHIRKGIDLSWAKLTDEDVKAIRLDTRPQTTIAKDYGITQTNVSQIKLRKSWRYVS